jgi:hypothetical protein
LNLTLIGTIPLGRLICPIFWGISLKHTRNI